MFATLNNDSMSFKTKSKLHYLRISLKKNNVFNFIHDIIKNQFNNLCHIVKKQQNKYFVIRSLNLIIRTVYLFICYKIV